MKLAPGRGSSSPPPFTNYDLLSLSTLSPFAYIFLPSFFLALGREQYPVSSFASARSVATFSYPSSFLKKKVFSFFAYPFSLIMSDLWHSSRRSFLVKVSIPSSPVSIPLDSFSPDLLASPSLANFPLFPEDSPRILCLSSH